MTIGTTPLQQTVDPSSTSANRGPIIVRQCIQEQLINSQTGFKPFAETIQKSTMTSSFDSVYYSATEAGRAIDFKFVKVRGDGNCFFRSISIAVNNDRGQGHEEVRDVLCVHLAEHEDSFVAFQIEADNAYDIDSTNWTLYVQKMGEDGVFGGNLEVKAAADLLQVSRHDFFEWNCPAISHELFVTTYRCHIILHRYDNDNRRETSVYPVYSSCLKEANLKDPIHLQYCIAKNGVDNHYNVMKPKSPAPLLVATEEAEVAPVAARPFPDYEDQDWVNMFWAILLTMDPKWEEQTRAEKQQTARDNDFKRIGDFEEAKLHVETMMDPQKNESPSNKKRRTK